MAVNSILATIAITLMIPLGIAVVVFVVVIMMKKNRKNNFSDSNFKESFINNDIPDRISSSDINYLKKLKELYDQDIISYDEYIAQKNKIVSIKNGGDKNGTN